MQSTAQLRSRRKRRGWLLRGPHVCGIHSLHQRRSMGWEKRQRTDSARSWDPSLASLHGSRTAEVPRASDALVCARKKGTSSGQRASVFHDLHFLTHWPKQSAATHLSHPARILCPTQIRWHISPDAIGWTRLSAILSSWCFRFLFHMRG